MKQDDIDKCLDDLRAQDNLRILRSMEIDGKTIVYNQKRYLNLSSNDYLGLSDDKTLYGEFLSQSELHSDMRRFLMSNPSSRLMTGNSGDYHLLENTIMSLYPLGNGALVVNCGYMVNTGVLPALTDKGDLILCDKLVHASLIDGLKLCCADWMRFRHNDMNHLESLLKKHRNKYSNVWVVTESIFSMDGDCAPLEDIVMLKHKYDFNIYLDEAHSFGVRGVRGAGYASEKGLSTEIDVLVATLGKSAASQGGFVVASERIIELLINRMRTLIYSTALPPISLMWSNFVVGKMGEFEARRRHLAELVSMVRGNDSTHIIPIMTYDNHSATLLAQRLRDQGYWVTPIRYPTVAKGSSRVRLSLNAGLTSDEIARFVDVWKSIG